MKTLWFVVLFLMMAIVPSAALADTGAELESRYGVVTDDVMNARLNRVAPDVMLSIHTMYPKCKKNLRFKILNRMSPGSETKDAADLNACAFGDGHIYITKGLMEAIYSPAPPTSGKPINPVYANIKPDDMLAAVLGHEATHIGQGHQRHQEEGLTIGAILGAAFSWATGGNTPDAIMNGVQIGSSLIYACYSRPDEKKSDLGAVELLKIQHRNPMAMAATLQMLVDRYGPGLAKVPVVGWFETHPDTNERIKWATEAAGQPLTLASNTAPTSKSSTAQSQLFGGKSPDAPEVVVAKFEAKGKDFGVIGQEEAMRILENRGYQNLAAADSADLKEIQKELELENSEWGKNGEGRNDIGNFAGTQFVVTGTVSAIGEGSTDIETRAASGRLRELTVEVVIKAWRSNRALAGKILKGRGTARQLSEIEISVLRRRWYGAMTEAEIDRRLYIDLSRRAIALAIEKALAGEPVLQAAVQQSQSTTVDLGSVNLDKEVVWTLYIQPKRAGGAEVIRMLKDTPRAFLAAGSVVYYRGDTAICRIVLDRASVKEAALGRTTDISGRLYAPATITSELLDSATSVRLIE